MKDIILKYNNNYYLFFLFSMELNEGESVQFSSVTQSCPTLCHPMECSKPGFPVHHHFPEFTQTALSWSMQLVKLHWQTAMLRFVWLHWPTVLTDSLTNCTDQLQYLRLLILLLAILIPACASSSPVFLRRENNSHLNHLIFLATFERANF